MPIRTVLRRPADRRLPARRLRRPRRPDRGIDRQRAAIARAAQRLGLSVAEEFIDLGASGITLDRPALRRLLDHITTRSVGYCIVDRLDRLSRDPVQQADLDEALSAAGVVVVDASPDIGEAGR